jgi:hypothetical protein
MSKQTQPTAKAEPCCRIDDQNGHSCDRHHNRIHPSEARAQPWSPRRHQERRPCDNGQNPRDRLAARDRQGVR